MDVEMGNRFTTMRTMVDDGAKASFGNSQFACDFAYSEQQVTEYCLIRLRGLANPRNRLSGNHQNMGWSLR